MSVCKSPFSHFPFFRLLCFNCIPGRTRTDLVNSARSVQPNTDSAFKLCQSEFALPVLCRNKKEKIEEGTVTASPIGHAIPSARKLLSSSHLSRNNNSSSLQFVTRAEYLEYGSALCRLRFAGSLPDWVRPLAEEEDILGSDSHDDEGNAAANSSGIGRAKVRGRKSGGGATKPKKKRQSTSKK
jgi:hypothetical protein